MAWDKHGERKYFYQSVRRNGKVHKTYFGAGQVGEMAAGAHALRRAERKAAQEALQRQIELVNGLVNLTRNLNQWCELIAAASLLAAGFHRPCRHAWRRWRNGRETLTAF
jgi:hypothetical protein